ncbi:MAG: hypothetical protein PVG55_04145 [Nitrospirota bacterium]|jgi:hypothetical protein
MENVMVIWYGATSFILGLILFFPTRKLISSIGINRFQRKENREATAEEAAAIRRRSTYIAAVVALTFAFVYNRVIMFKYFGGAGGQ